MDGRAIFNFMIERIPGTVQRCLSKNGLEAKDIDLFVFHQASRFMVESLRKRMGLDAVRVPVDLGDVGNTVSSSIPLLLSRRMDRGGLAGQRVLVSGFGVGLSWATNVLNFGGAS
jgi:3-oxoacyl-[acyl-carrier-protein] synthase-3